MAMINLTNVGSGSVLNLHLLDQFNRLIRCVQQDPAAVNPNRLPNNGIMTENNFDFDFQVWDLVNEDFKAIYCEHELDEADSKSTYISSLDYHLFRFTVTNYYALLLVLNKARNGKYDLSNEVVFEANLYFWNLICYCLNSRIIEDREKALRGECQMIPQHDAQFMFDMEFLGGGKDF